MLFISISVEFSRETGYFQVDRFVIRNWLMEAKRPHKLESQESCSGVLVGVLRPENQETRGASPCPGPKARALEELMV